MTKLLQAVANEKGFGCESWMFPFNDFVTSSVPTLHAFWDDIVEVRDHGRFIGASEPCQHAVPLQQAGQDGREAQAGIGAAEATLQMKQREMGILTKFILEHLKVPCAALVRANPSDGGPPFAIGATPSRSSRQQTGVPTTSYRRLK